MELIDLRCPGCNKLLGKASGSDFTVEVKCPVCRAVRRFTYPHPLGYTPPLDKGAKLDS